MNFKVLFVKNNVILFSLYSICDAIQKYSMGTVEKWIIFNKKVCILEVLITFVTSFCIGCNEN